MQACVQHVKETIDERPGGHTEGSGPLLKRVSPHRKHCPEKKIKREAQKRSQPCC